MYRKEPVRGYEEYQVDTNGVVYSKKGKPLKYSVNPRGYAIVNFMVSGRRIGFAIHTLVAKQFLGEHTTEQNQVNHIDGNKLNNHVDNLEWSTGKENMWHARNIIDVVPHGSKHCRAKGVTAYNPRTGKIEMQFNSLSDAAIHFTNPGSKSIYPKNGIYRAIHGIRKTYRGLLWRYQDTAA